MRILLIDDSIFIFNMITKILETESVMVIPVNTAKDAFEALQEGVPDLILLSMVLPDMDGQIVCQRLKNMPSLRGVPIIFVSANNDEASIIKGFEAGATDYIVKPFSSAELKARVTCHLQNKLMADKLRITNQKLVSMMEELKLQSYKDPLTNSCNRKFFLEHIEAWKMQQKKENYQSFLYMIDVDNFKGINDTYGHATGDYSLLTIASLIKDEIPEGSALIRWGGDEFLLMVFRISAAKAAQIGDTLQKKIENHPFSFDGYQFSCSLTIGFTEFFPELKIEDHISLADKALYAGKEKGRNLCINAEDFENPCLGDSTQKD